MKKENLYNSNVEYFNGVLRESILYFVNKKNKKLNIDEIDLDFISIYDICEFIGVSVGELVEKMEGEFTK